MSSHFHESTGNYREDAVALESNDMPLLYSKQSTLPKLPVPEIKDTLRTFLPTALPLVASEREHESLMEQLASFERQAETLQERLKHRAASLPNSSWLQEWWNVQGYLQPRCSNVIHVSYFFRLSQSNSTMSALQRAAAILQSSVLYQEHLVTSKTPDQLRNQQSLCSSQYKYLFHSSRVPGKGADTVRIHDRTMASNKHAVVASSGQFYSIPLYCPQTQQVLSHSAFHHLLSCIQAEASGTETTTPTLGILTTQNRTDWYDDYTWLRSRSSSMNHAMNHLESGMLLLCLDDTSSNGDPTRLAETLWHGVVGNDREGNSHNRWFDKSAQLVVGHDASLGYIGEHAMADGMSVTEFCRSVEQAKYNKSDEAESDLQNLKATPIFRDAIQSLSDSDFHELNERVQKAQDDFKHTTDKYGLTVLEYSVYGSRMMKRSGFSPDAFVQCALQLAADRFFGRTVATYESAQTRQFLHGRTETTRSVSPETQAFCRMVNRHPRNEKKRDDMLDALRKACAAQSEYSRKAIHGLGCDRHFFGLQNCLLPNETAPDLFSHPVFLRSKQWLLSTSTLPGTAPGFGPVEEQGIGVGYDVRENSVIFTVTAMKAFNNVDEFQSHVERALNEMKDIISASDAKMSKL